MLKYEHIADGAYIRAFDFEPLEGREPRYIEGTITGRLHVQGVKVFQVEVKVDTAFTRVHSRVGLPIYVPMETLFDYDGRIEVR